MTTIDKPRLTRNAVNRAKSDIIKRHYAAGTWPSPACTAQLRAIEAVWSQADGQR